jgi:hypothetical protein
MARLVLIACLIATLPAAGCASFAQNPPVDASPNEAAAQPPAETDAPLSEDRLDLSSFWQPSHLCDFARPANPPWVQYDWTDTHPLCAAVGAVTEVVVLGAGAVAILGVYALAAMHRASPD